MTLHTVDKIARYNPETKEWTEFPMPQAETDVRRIQFDANHPNRIWWSGVANHAAHRLYRAAAGIVSPYTD